MGAKGTLAPLCCAQCGCELPFDSGDREGWRSGGLLAAGELDELTAPMLLCPDCAAEDVRGEFEPGGGD